MGLFDLLFFLEASNQYFIQERTLALQTPDISFFEILNEHSFGERNSFFQGLSKDLLY
jgi:hypothetical protein